MDETYLKRMQEMLQGEYPDYISSLEKPSHKGMRINNLRIKEEDFFKLTQFHLEKSPFASNGYYLDRNCVYGNTMAFEAGLFYMQEPSASSAVTVLDPQEGDKVLDMCAAPGSKTTQIAEKLNNTGFLVANEINSSRAKILVENVDKYGASNVLVLNNDTSVLAKTFPGYFDKVLCDAPCSGEGMMRKNDIASKQWSLDNVLHCAKLQKEILHNAYTCLKEDGILVYSTCTFAYEENEWQIKEFLSQHEDMELVDINVEWGRKAFDLPQARRIFPMDEGEGHFICKMRKKSSTASLKLSGIKSPKFPSFVSNFLSENLTKQFPCYYVFDNKVYGGIIPFYELKKVHIIRYQVYLGEIKKNRFEPSYSFFMNSYASCKNKLDVGEEDIKKYITGQTLDIMVPKGWYSLCYEGYPISGTYSDGRILKNKYPHTLRKR